MLENVASKSFSTFYNIIKLVVALVLNIFLWMVFIKAVDGFTRAIITPFCICAIAVLMQVIGLIHNQYKLVKICKGIYMCCFLLYIFGFLSIWCYYAVKEKMYGMLIFPIPFLIIGIFIIYKLIKGEIK